MIEQTTPQHIPTFDIDQLLTIADRLGVDFLVYGQKEIIKFVIERLQEPDQEPKDRAVIIYANNPTNLDENFKQFAQTHTSYLRDGDIITTNKFLYQVIKQPL